MVLYLMVICVVMLYILSIVYVIRDAQRRGAEPWWMWAIISVIPIVGLLAYVILRPSSYLIDREEQDLDIALQSTMTSSCAPTATRRSATSAPPATARSTRTGRSAPTAAPASSSGRVSPPHPRPGEKRALLAWPFAVAPPNLRLAGRR